MSHASEHDRGLRKRSVGGEQPSAGHLQVEQQVQRLNDLLRAVRNVNQLIAREKDRDRLLGGACESLTATRGYQSVWIAVVDESQNLVTAAEAGVGEDLQRLFGPTEHGRWCDCARRAHAMKGDRERCLAAGMDAYVAKPIRRRELFETIGGLFQEFRDRQ